jgi:hypothetical protein
MYEEHSDEYMDDTIQYEEHSDDINQDQSQAKPSQATFKMQKIVRCSLKGGHI